MKTCYGHDHLAVKAAKVFCEEEKQQSLYSFKSVKNTGQGLEQTKISQLALYVLYFNNM